MPVPTNKVEDPCQECRDRHLKCDDERPRCKQCARLGEECHRSKGKAKFRFGSSARFDTRFSKDQIWLAQSKNAKLQFVDQGPELENYYAADDIEPTLAPSPPSLQSPHPPPLTLSPATTAPPPRAAPVPTSLTEDRTNGSNTIHLEAASDNGENRSPTRRSFGDPEIVVISPATNSIDTVILPPPKRRKTNENVPPDPVIVPNQSPRIDQDPNRFYVLREHPRSAGTLGQHNGIGSPDVPEPVKKKVYAEYERIEDSNAAAVPEEELLSPAIWKEHFIWPNHLTTTQCTCLMRYYTDHLGPWLDVGDPSRNFTLAVPQRARRCPPLLNAIFTIAARHLFCIPKYRSSGVVKYGRNRMPRLDEGQAIKYQNASIAYLKELCNHPEHVQDEDLLAATVILRYYEEFDTALGGERVETVMRPFQLFVTAQAYPTFSFQLPYGPTIDFAVPGSYTMVRHDVEEYLSSYQHACFRIALRQECARAFMKQQPIGLDLQAWSMLEGFDEAEDFVWTDRHLYHLARVLQFCFDSDSRGQHNTSRWEELKKFEQLWEDNKPLSFAAIHYDYPDRSTGEVLPEIWYLAEIHALATQYLNMSRILLAVYNPTLPRLGPGAALAQKQMSAKVREAVIELCGIAVSLPGCEPALIQACMAIALCGEHFSARHEQESLLTLLTRLETEHGLETQSTAQSLKQAWMW